MVAGDFPPFRQVPLKASSGVAARSTNKELIRIEQKKDIEKKKQKIKKQKKGGNYEA